MAEKIMQYRDLNHALKLMRGQIIEGIPYAQEQCPQLSTPEKVFNWLKIRTTYKHDPKNIELFQTLPTLLEDNYHGQTGKGDCDCFTISALTLLLANGFHNSGIVLVGRNPFNPVHIYAYTIDENNKKIYLDLTNKMFNYERNYPYKQHIKFNLTPKEKKTMQLQLAEQTPYIGYIWMPSQGVQIREDAFDHLSGGEFQDIMLNEGLNLSEICQLAGKRKERRAEKRATKKERKDAKTDIKKAKAEKKRASGEAKKSRATRERKSGKEIFDNVIDSAKQGVETYKSIKGDVENTTDTPTTAGKKADAVESDYYTIMGQQVKKPIAIIGGIAIVGAIGYGIYKSTK